MGKKYKKITWKCGVCDSIQESYSNRRWDMDVCKCGHSGMDLEEWYSREMGGVIIIKEEILEENNEKGNSRWKC
jgi:uncharacterized phosphosugar-binding protein